MFERYTEKARRVIFFARYEASNYGSHYIESEHLLLGLLREDHSLVRWFPGEKNVEPDIRAEIEKRITRAERISTSVEIPLTTDCKKILNLAAEASERLGHRAVETEHLLIGILRVESSLAAQVLFAKGLKSEPIQEQLAKSQSPKYQCKSTISASLALDSFLAGLRWLNSEELISFFARNAEFIDASGKRCNREELYRGFETLFAPYAKKNASYVYRSNACRIKCHVCGKCSVEECHPRQRTTRLDAPNECCSHS
jgi:ATP-dependent Clp protease ATP-binding subunit ClpA